MNIPHSETDLILNKDGSIYHLNLLPSQVSDTIITVGDPGRVHQVAQFFDSIEAEINKREFVTITGNYKGKRLSVISTGIGPDNIEIFFNEMDALFNYNLKKRVLKDEQTSLKIIRIGTSGAIQSDIAVGESIVSEYAVGLDNIVGFYPLASSEEEKSIADSIKAEVDLPTHPYVVSSGQELFEIFSKKFKAGNTVTCPGFYAPQGRSLRLESEYPKIMDQFTFFHKHDFWISNFEMETAAYYAFSKMMGHQAISVSAILANRAENTFSKKPTKVMEELIKQVLQVIYESDL